MSRFLFLCLAVAMVWWGTLTAQNRRTAGLTQILGRPTCESIALSVMAPERMEAGVEFGTATGRYTRRTPMVMLEPGVPHEFQLDGLAPGTRYFYRVNSGPEYSFSSCRGAGTPFSFGVEGDSHPERAGKMYDAELFERTLQTAASHGLDFYIALGDDFSLDRLYRTGRLNAGTVDALYAEQRRYFGIAGRTSAFFHVNGNHEHAARYLLDGTKDAVAVLAGRARIRHYPLPAPDGFYSGDTEPVEHVGLPRDYYAWTWGDALFVALDPYWHSPVAIDSGLGGGSSGRRVNGWEATMGDAQYHWLRRVLEQSAARYKFVFVHHVLGTGRGALAVSDLFEWGGRNRQGEVEFKKYRPGWPLPVHSLLAKHGVSVVFQGHDHLFAREEKNGVVYQTAPNPADASYTAFNREAYGGGTVLGNSGYLRVSVRPERAVVEYIRSWLPKDESAGRKHGEVAYSYFLEPK